MIRRPPRSTRTDTLFPYTTLSDLGVGGALAARSAARPPRRRAGVDQGHLADHGLADPARLQGRRAGPRSEEHTSELQSLMRISYAVFCLNKKNTKTIRILIRKQDD